MTENIPSPKEFMRKRRPEKFSDSLPVEHTQLEISVLEYHLDTITSRNQEMDFERFARAIAEREICPNLLPHTGPMGGGDSKVDTETYPVADKLSIGWYEGIGREAAEERWAFAISAKADWRAKIRSDVSNIIGTQRPYKKIFFLTNQFVKDKDRADLEDELRQEHDIDVRILDRSWLVESVLKGGHESIAVATLGVPSILSREVRRGPRDIEREQKLQQLDNRIRDSLSDGPANIPLVELALESALLARSLEKQRPQIDGRFLRAKDLAELAGTRHQRLNALYQWAWATYWWFEDMNKFSELYSEVENLALGTDIVNHLELLSNLWMCLHSSVSTGRLDLESDLLQERTDALMSDLERLENETLSVGSALYARTLMLQAQLLIDPSLSAEVFEQLQEVVQQADSLANYPFTTITQLLTEIGRPLGDVEGYNELFELVVDIAARREGELTAANLLLKRASDLIEEGKNYSAIATLGVVLSKLYKDESRDHLVRALYMIGYVYAQVGLPWAARGSLINASSIASHLTWTQGEVTRLQTECCRQIKWLELELGRIPQSLDWHRVEAIFRQLITEDDNSEIEEEEITLFDGALGILFLRADISTLRLLEALPDSLERLYLPASSLALLFSLGHEEYIPESWHDPGPGTQSPEMIFRLWRDQPASSDLPLSFSLGLEPFLEMKSSILGCQVILKCENISPCVELAETVLSAMESFFSTAVVTQLVSYESKLHINVRRSEFADVPFTFRMIVDEDIPQLIVACRNFSPHTLSHEEQEVIQQLLTDMLISLFANVFFAGDVEETVTTLIQDQRALERAVSFTRSFVTLGNVLGYQPRTVITDWIEENDRVYTLHRQEPWDEPDRIQKNDQQTLEHAESDLPQVAPGGEPPPELVENFLSAKHSEIKTVSIIRLPLWNEARWIGAAFITVADDVKPPILALIFENGRPATAIFEGWRKDLGEKDTAEQIYVSVIRGISTDNPSAYRILIGANPFHALQDESAKYVYMVYRVQTMEPITSENLDRFLRSYEKANRYMLTPAITTGDQSEPIIGDHLGIEKIEIHVKQAWQVRRHDPEISAIMPEDNPIIPGDALHVPVREVLEMKRRNI